MPDTSITAARAPGEPRPPVLEVVGPDGRRLLIAPRSSGDRVGELAEAIATAERGAAPRDAEVVVDGRPVARDATLGEAAVVRGSRIRWHDAATLHAPVPPVATVTVVAGPGSGPPVALPPGRHVIGRGRHVPVLVDDAAIEPQHGVLDISPAGTVSFTQLAGRSPLRIDGRTVTGAISLTDGTTMHIGASRITVATSSEVPASDATSSEVPASDATATLSPAPGDPWRLAVWRTPRAVAHWEPAPVHVPSTPLLGARSAGFGLAPALVGAAGAAALALLLGQPMFFVFSLLGVLVAAASWIGGRVGAARDRRNAGAAHQREVDAFGSALSAQTEARRQFHVRTTPTVSEAIAATVRTSSDLWSRRATHADAFAVTLGWGPVRWRAAIGDGDLPPDLSVLVTGAETLDDVPVATVLGAGTTIAVTGDHAAPVVRSIIVQLATWTGPADWRLVVIVDDLDTWDWCRWLPHSDVGDDALVVDAGRPDAIAAAIGRLDGGDARHVVLVTDRSDLLTVRTGCVRRFLSSGASVAVVVQTPSSDRVPALCRSVLEVGSLGGGRWIADTSVPGLADRLHVAGVSIDVAADAARRLARLHDPEDPRAASTIVGAVSLGTLVARHGVGPIDDAIAVAAAWRSNGADPPPAGVIGVARDGIVELDLVRDGPHALIAGTTGSGKSELLRTMIASLAARSSPDHLTFVLVDYKGGSTFDACAELPHVVGLVTDLDDRLAERALISLGAELQRRERLLRQAAVADLTGYRVAGGHPPLPRLVVVIDEFAALAAELSSFVSALVGIAQRGRSLGVHLVLATQRPAGVVSDEIRANTNLRIALRLQDVAEARDIVGDPSPADFTRSAHGRAMMRLGPGDTTTFQAARSTGPVAEPDEALHIVTGTERGRAREVTELTVLVRSIRHAAALCDVAPPHRPWLPPLPTRLDRDALVDLDDGAIGLVDDPGAQRRHPLRWSPADGNLALVGGRGTGTTTALLAVLVGAVRTHDAGALHVYAVDASGDARFDPVERLPHCGAVVRLHETERLSRLLRTLRDELDRRRVPTVSGRPQTVLAIDGFAALRAALDRPGTADELDALLRIVAEGPDIGIACVLTAERPGAIAPSVLAACAERWVLHLDDRTEAPAAGIPPALVPARIPGRLVAASTRLEAQVAELPISAAGELMAPSSGGPPPVIMLPAEVDERNIGCGRRAPAGELWLPLGLDYRTLDATHVTVNEGEHVLVAGPPRSGRSTALGRLARAWRQAHPDGVAVLVRHSSARSIVELDGLTSVDAEDVPTDAAARTPCLVVIDDAERVDDPAGDLADLIASRRPGVLVVAAGRPETLRSLYGHWTTVLRRSRLGLLMSSCAADDGDVLGVVLPRNPPIRPRPGLAWVVSGGDHHLVQLARQF